MDYQRYKQITDHRITIFLVTVFIAAVLAGCSDAPFSFEDGELPFTDITDVVRDITVYTDTTSVIALDVSSGLKPYLLIGDYRNKKCSMLAKYANLPSGVTAVRARLYMQSRSVYGDSSTAMTASVRTVNGTWDEENVPDITFSDAKAEFTITSLAGARDSVDIPIDIIQGWIDDSETNDGFYLTPENAAFAKQFYAKESDSPLQLRLTYDSDGDIFTEVYVPTQDAFLVESSQDPGDAVFTTNYRPHKAILRFDFSALPERAVVNFAELVLNLNLARSALGKEGDYQFVSSQIMTESWDPDEMEISSVNAFAATMDENYELRISVAAMVQGWISNVIDSEGNPENANFGLLLFSSTEKYDLSEFIFYDESSSPVAGSLNTLQPRLEIRYTDFRPNQPGGGSR